MTCWSDQNTANATLFNRKVTFLLAKILTNIFLLISLTDYTGQGVDQLQKIIDTIKKNPEDRRIIMCAWNPKGAA